MLAGGHQGVGRGLHGPNPERITLEGAAESGQDGRLIIHDKKSRHRQGPAGRSHKRPRSWASLDGTFSICRLTSEAACGYDAGKMNANSAPPSESFSPRMVPP